MGHSVCARITQWYRSGQERMMTSWDRFPHYWLFVRRIHRLTVNSLPKGPKMRASIFGVSLNPLLNKQTICRWDVTLVKYTIVHLCV